MYENPEDLPGIQKLCKLLFGVPKWEVLGDCPRIRMFIDTTTPHALNFELEAEGLDGKARKKRAQKLARKGKALAVRAKKNG